MSVEIILRIKISLLKLQHLKDVLQIPYMTVKSCIDKQQLVLKVEDVSMMFV